jgi:hypothetical protein
VVPCFNNVMCRNSSGFVFTSRKYVILIENPENAFLFVYAVFFDNDHRDAYIGGDTVESITTSRGILRCCSGMAVLSITTSRTVCDGVYAFR